MPDPRGYVLLAACQADERAFEGWYDASGPGGALTWALLDAVRRLGSEATCRQLHDRILPQVREWHEGQTPQLEGDADWIFLDSEEHAPRSLSAGDRPRGLDDSQLAGVQNPESYLTGQLRLALYRLPVGFDPTRTWGGALLALVDRLEPLVGEVTARVGEWLCLEVENVSRQSLHVTILDHEPGGGVGRVYPAPGVGQAHLLPAAGREALPLEAQLPGELRRGTDIIQAIAAADMTFFHRYDASAPDRWDWTVTRRKVHLVREEVSSDRRGV